MPDTSIQLATLSTGPLEYLDTGGEGATMVLLPGLFMDESLWQQVVDHLGDRYRCVVPVLPMGAHRKPTNAGTALSLPVIARLVLELLDHLDLSDVVLVGNDTGGAVAQLVVAADAARIGRLVLVSCDAFDNVPPGLTGKTLVATGMLPPALFGAFMQQMRLRLVRRLPIAFGWLTKRGDQVSAGWIQPVLHQPGVRSDMVTLLRSIKRDRGVLLDEQANIAAFPGPVLVVWSAEDKVMPVEHAHRLQQLFSRAEVSLVRDTYTLVPLDQPAHLARIISEWEHRTLS